MPDAATFTMLAVAAALSAWAARRDLQLPVWLTIATFAGGSLTTSLAFGPQFAPIGALAISCLLVAEADRRHQLIPDFLTLAVLALAVIMPFGDGGGTRVIGAAALGATFLIIRQAISALRGAEALGWGDVKFATAMGAVLGPIYGFSAVAVAGLATLLVITVRARGGTAAIGAPFGIGLATATAAVAFVRAMAL